MSDQARTKITISISEEDYQRLRKRMTYGDSFATAIKHLLDETEPSKQTIENSNPTKDTTSPQTSG